MKSRIVIIMFIIIIGLNFLTACQKIEENNIASITFVNAKDVSQTQHTLYMYSVENAFLKKTDGTFLENLKTDFNYIIFSSPNYANKSNEKIEALSGIYKFLPEKYSIKNYAYYSQELSIYVKLQFETGKIVQTFPVKVTDKGQTYLIEYYTSQEYALTNKNMVTKKQIEVHKDKVTINYK